MRIAQAKNLYILSPATMAKVTEMICSRCNEGFEIGQWVLSKSRKAHARYGLYHKNCAEEVNLLP